MKKNDFFEDIDLYSDDAVLTTKEEMMKKREKTGAQRKRKRKGRILADELIGKCLVRIGGDGRDIYNQAVIYVTDCTAEMVKGIMINKLLFGTAAIECKSRDSDQENVLKNVYEDLYQGGPENPAHGFVLFPKEDYIEGDPFAEIHGDVAISTSFGVLQEILDGEGPEKKIIAMGHCLWRRGELEWEIFNNQWLVVPSDLELIFDTKFEERWAKARRASGVDWTTYMPQIGLA